jgi:hypothetical protein
MSKQKSNVNDLLNAIKRQTPSATPPRPEPIEEIAAPAAPTEKRAKDKAVGTSSSEIKPARKIGRALQFWMHDADVKLIRELSAWLAGQGVRPSDSQVIRAALRFAKTGGNFLEAYHQAAKSDGRLKRD